MPLELVVRGLLLQRMKALKLVDCAENLAIIPLTLDNDLRARTTYILRPTGRCEGLAWF